MREDRQLLFASITEVTIDMASTAAELLVSPSAVASVEFVNHHQLLFFDNFAGFVQIVGPLLFQSVWMISLIILHD